MKLNFKQGRGNKIHIHVDGEYKMTVDSDFIAAGGYFENMNISETELAALEDAVSSRRAFNKAVELLSRRDHSKGELLTKLRQKGFSEGAEEAVEKLEEYGYVDDYRFAKMFSGELARLKKYGKSRIKQELYKKGVSRDIIDSVLEEIEFDSESLVSVIEKKYFRNLDSVKGVKKTVNALLRMGYSYSEIKEALNVVKIKLEETDDFID